MRLVLLRHGPAGAQDPARWPDDRDRPLTERGAERTQRACAGLARLEPGIATVLASPLRRCAETAACLRGALGSDANVRSTGALEPGGAWPDLLRELEALPEAGTAALVGHEPDLGNLAGLLLFGAPASLPLRKAGACAIEFDSRCAPGQGRLRWFLPPRSLRRLARHGSTV